MTNYEAIKNMSPEEMAKFLCSNDSGVPCECCTGSNDPDACKANIQARKDWLNEESEE